MIAALLSITFAMSERPRELTKKLTDERIAAACGVSVAAYRQAKHVAHDTSKTAQLGKERYGKKCVVGIDETGAPFVATMELPKK